MTQPTEATVSPELIAEAVKRALAALGSTAGSTPPAGSGGTLTAETDFPLAAKRPELVQSASGLSLEQITLEKIEAGQISFDDIKIRPETLEYQAQIAESVGRPHLAQNLRRAAELTRIPDARVLEIYSALRPYRCTHQELLDIAEELETTYQAKTCAGLVREAADIYKKRKRLKQ